MANHRKYDNLSGVSIQPEIPDKPSWLDGIGSAEWGRVTGILSEANVLTALDQSALGIYCHLYSEFVRTGDKFPPGKLSQLRLLLSQLGLTPLSRNQLQTITPPKRNKYDEDQACSKENSYESLL